MHFYVSDRVLLLFSCWNVHSLTGMLLTMMVILLIATVYEILKVLTVKLDKKALDLITPTPLTAEEVTETAPNNSARNSSSRQRWIRLHSSQSLLHIVQVAISYLLMLCAMSYNVWVFLSIVVGAGIGYFLAYPLINRC
ncbi:probable low affinity copper uptake protein 2 [Callorhinchus milii]|uniref:Copper transport protein n=1 Tax=Callorhinchus milii TaxID=7868 RepID=V9L876_CALMI|nr:probable low affinity copper uptake protein 2 [Callorhinchus milii]|eukprot:gi/632981854/ref/XP_007907818.1/ PREDICTED: probable low affinity copper uptake protein 2 [Callorhinchus milii]